MSSPKVSGFTLSEVLIGMIIISLVISIGFWSLNMFSGIFTDGSKTLNKMQQDCNGLIQISRDVFNGQTVIKTNTGISIDEIQYYIANGNLIRKTGLHVDTLFNADKIIIPEKVIINQEKKLINYFEVQVPVGKENRRYPFSKQYDANTLLSINNNEGN